MAAGETLQARGYHAQAVAADEAVALFYLNSGREAIKKTTGGFAVGDHIEPADRLIQQAREHPELFSPNVLLRPLVQDTVFPTACYVAGPNELGYLGQLKGVYEAFGLPMPLIQQRATATLVDANTMKFLSRHEFPFEALRAQARHRRHRELVVEGREHRLGLGRVHRIGDCLRVLLAVAPSPSALALRVAHDVVLRLADHECHSEAAHSPASSSAASPSVPHASQGISRVHARQVKSQ
jgi:hypothetical protein